MGRVRRGGVTGRGRCGCESKVIVYLSVYLFSYGLPNRMA